jgi:hypothetical protein
VILATGDVGKVNAAAGLTGVDTFAKPYDFDAACGKPATPSSAAASARPSAAAPSILSCPDNQQARGDIHEKARSEIRGHCRVDHIMFCRAGGRAG